MLLILLERGFGILGVNDENYEIDRKPAPKAIVSISTSLLTAASLSSCSSAMQGRLAHEGILPSRVLREGRLRCENPKHRLSGEVCCSLGHCGLVYLERVATLSAFGSVHVMDTRAVAWNILN